MLGGITGWGLGSRSWGWGCGSGLCASSPDKDFAIFVRCYPLGFNQFVFEPFEIVLIEIELQGECTVGHTAFGTEKLSNLV